MLRRWTWIFKHLWQAKRWFVFGTLLLILESLAQISAVMLQKWMIDDVFVAGEYDRFWIVLSWIALAALCFTVIVIFSPYVANKGTARHTTNIGSEFLQHLRRMPMDRWRKQRVGDIAHYFSNDVMTVANLIGEQIPLFIWYLFTVATLMAVVGWGSLTILAAITLFGILYIVAGRYLGRRVRQLSRDVQEKKSDLLVHIEEGISSTRETIAYHRMKWEKAIYDRLFKAYFEQTMQLRKADNRRLWWGDPLRWGATLVVLGYGGLLVIQGEMSIGLFVVIFQFTALLMGNMREWFDNAMHIHHQLASVDRLLEWIGDEDKTRPEATLIEEKVIQEFRFEQVDFDYGDGERAVHHVSFALPLGQKTAFVGPSGAGKSTIALLMTGLFVPQNGSIRLNGHDLSVIAEEERARRISIVFQEPYLFPSSIRDNLCMGDESITERHMHEVCKGICIHEDIVVLPDGYDSVIGERGITLSGGQRQRIAISRALLRDPEILILDEATSALDLETERRVQAFLDEIRKGKTTVVIAHRLSTVQNANLIFVVKDGTIAEQGTHETLLHGGEVYKKLVEAR